MLTRAEDRALGGGDNFHAVLLRVTFHDVLQLSGFLEHTAAGLFRNDQYIHQRQDAFDGLSCFVFTPQVRTVVHVKGDERAVFLEFFQHLNGHVARAQRQADPA